LEGRNTGNLPVAEEIAAWAMFRTRQIVDVADNKTLGDVVIGGAVVQIGEELVSASADSRLEPGRVGNVVKRLGPSISRLQIESLAEAMAQSDEQTIV